MTTFAIIATLAGIARIALFVALHIMRSDYNIVEHAVSDYAVGRTRHATTAMTWFSALAWLTLAGAVWAGLDDWADQHAVALQLVILAAIFVVLPFVPTDIEGTTLTRIGALHYVLAIAWFALSYNLTGNFARLLDGTALGGVLTALHWVALVSLIVLVAALVTPLRRRLFGISERVFLIVISVFYLLVAIELIAF